MAGNVLDVTDATFDSEILNADQPVLVDYWATWCGPCKQIAPHVANLADEFSGKLKVAKIDVQSNMKSARASKVANIPTLIVFKGGQEVARHTGAAGIDVLRNFVSAHV